MEKLDERAEERRAARHGTREEKTEGEERGTSLAV